MDVRAIGAADAAAVVPSAGAQGDRLRRVDPRLPRGPGPRKHAQGVVVCGADGAVVGYARPVETVLAEDDEMRAVAPDRALVWHDLAVSDPRAVEALVAGVGRPDSVHVVSWPSADTTLDGPLRAAGLTPTFQYSLRPPGPLTGRADVPIRRARPDDAERLLALHLEEVAFHTRYTDSVRLVAGLTPAFRTRLARVWAGDDPATAPDTSILHVVEVSGEVVGMCESMLMDSGAGGRLLPAGRYGYLNSVGVSERHRGAGLGTALVAAALGDLAVYGAGGTALWVSTTNPIASRVWPRLGFTPLWTSYSGRLGSRSSPVASDVDSGAPDAAAASPARIR